MPRRSPSKDAHDLVQAVTGSKPVRGEDLLGDPKLVKMLREAKAKEAARKKKGGK